MEKNRGKIALVLFLFLAFVAVCIKQNTINKEYVLQIKQVGLRKDVFIRRYQLTGEYGTHDTFSADMLKRYISTVLEPNYLLAQHAYDLGLHVESETAQKIKEYRINLLADNHPIQYQAVTILKNDLRDFYNKKRVNYDLEIIETACYSAAESLHTLLLAGQMVQQPQKEFQEQSFPRYSHAKALTYGDRLHPKLFPILENMQNGDVCSPIYTSSVWTILKLNKKEENKNLGSFDDMEQQLLAQAQVIFKYNQKQELITDLLKENKLTHRAEMYQPIIDAFTTDNNVCRIDEHKLQSATLADPFIQSNEEYITLAHFIAVYNQAHQFNPLQSITEKDLEYFIRDYSAQFALYLDACKKGIEHNTLIQDKLQNKEHRILIATYLNDEIMRKIVITEDEARTYYAQHQGKWQGAYESVSPNVKSELRSLKLAEKKQEIINRLQKRYTVRYNDPLLLAIAEQLTNDKKAIKQ